jgi:hypothetical protein
LEAADLGSVHRSEVQAAELANLLAVAGEKELERVEAGIVCQKTVQTRFGQVVLERQKAPTVGSAAELFSVHSSAQSAKVGRLFFPAEIPY